ncbi:MAG: MerR family transcriptional regulator [Actinomycetota bacterium]
MNDAAHQSIGEVLSLLKEEHPDVTISKIRFLESQGLITPERTPSGYRKFLREDVDRLRWILTQQRDNFLPLKVIKRRLAEDGFDPSGDLAADAVATAPVDDTPSAAAPLPEPSLFAERELSDESSGDDALATEAGEPDAAAPPEPAEPVAAGPTGSAPAEPSIGSAGSVSMTAGELAEATGTDLGFIGELEKLGLVVAVDTGAGSVFDHEALITARAAAAFRAQGMEVRHLRMYKVAADREAGMLQQLKGAALSRGGPSAADARAELVNLIGHGEAIHRSLLRRSLGLDD